MAITLEKVGIPALVGGFDVVTDYIDDAVKVDKTVAGVQTKVPLTGEIYSTKNISRLGLFIAGLAGSAGVFGKKEKIYKLTDPLFISTEPLVIRTVADMAKGFVGAGASPYTPGRVSISRVKSGSHWRPAGVPPKAISSLRFS